MSMGFSWDWSHKSLGIYHDLPGLVICNIAIENGTFIVDLPIKDGDFLQLC